MQNPKNLVLNAVNLDGYSSSPGFVGYFERVGKYVNGMAENAVAHMIEMLSCDIDEWVLVSSLHANEDEVGRFGDTEADIRDSSLVDFLYAHRALAHFSYRARFGTNYESASYASAIESALRDLVQVPARSLGIDVVRQLLVARMLVYGLRGHCFLISMRKGLIFYPHDDTGIGVICFGDMPRMDVALEFLDQSARIEGFRSVIVK